ncbi:MAG: hypothetical protein R3F11_05790 [Verrucomicrobiales bacterium]
MTGNLRRDSLEIGWKSIAGARYRVQASGNLQAWANASAEIIAESATTSAEVARPSAPPFFVRIVRLSLP